MRDRPHIRMRVLPGGEVAFTDPDPDALGLIRTFDPEFTVRCAPLPGFTRPRLHATRGAGTGLAMDTLSKIPDGQLWALHDNVPAHRSTVRPSEASLLDVKGELAMRMLRQCELCARRCRVNRLMDERGSCGLGADAFVYEAYVHIAEEPPINPALNVSLRGCAMRCVFCQQAAALNPKGRATERLGPDFWKQINLSQARSLVFVGGNPTESLPGVLAFLRAAPADFDLPIGWNCSGYDSTDAVRLLNGVVDAYVPDFKYIDDACATTLSDATGYAVNAVSAIEAMLQQGVPVFVRVLILPGHVECCHEPAMATLAEISSRSNLYVSIQGTYLPEWIALSPESPLSDRPRVEEVVRVRAHARRLGLTLVEWGRTA